MWDAEGGQRTRAGSREAPPFSLSQVVVLPKACTEYNRKLSLDLVPPASESAQGLIRSGFPGPANAFSGRPSLHKQRAPASRDLCLVEPCPKAAVVFC